MKRMLLALFVLVTGCASNPPPAAVGLPYSDIICWSEQLAGHGQEWQRVAAKTLGTPPVVFTCHGDDIAGTWVLTPDAPRKNCSAASVAQALHSVFPDRPIVFISCNPGRHELHVQGVFYCKKLPGVWSMPGNDTRTLLSGEVRTLAGHFEGDFEEGTK